MSYNNCQGEVLLLGKKEHATELTKIEIFFFSCGRNSILCQLQHVCGSTINLETQLTSHLASNSFRFRRLPEAPQCLACMV